jgi:hypothetical protein
MEYYKNLDLEDIHYIDDEGQNKIERWKDVPDFIGVYQASNLGRVKSLSRYKVSHCKCLTLLKSRILNQTSQNRYLRVSLRANNCDKKFLTHRLVMLSFCENYKNLPIVEHKNDNPSDNRLENLMWSTHKQNTIHAWENKLCKPHIGEENKNSKLTEKQVLEIRKSNLKNIELAKIYNVNRTSIIRIKSKKVWSHI